MMKFLDDEGREGTGVGRKAVLRAHAPRPSMSGAECSCGERFATWEEYGWTGNGVLDRFLEDESLFGEFLRTPVSEGGVESLVVEPPHIVVEVGA